MAKQTSVITLNGKMGAMSFYKTKDGYFAREKGGVSRSRFMNDPKFARTRENIREFNENIKAVKLLKDTIRPAVVKISDSKLHQRLVQQMMTVLKSDLLNSRGDRKVKEGDWTLLSGLELNIRASLTGSLLTEIGVTNSPTDWAISIPGFQPSDFLTVPDGASHFRLFAAGASVDFDLGNRSYLSNPTAALPLTSVTEVINLTVSKATLTETHRIFILGVEFLQMVNGQEYAINNGAHNAAAILLAEKS